MSDATASDPIMQLLQSQGAPKTAQEMRNLLDGFAPILNAEPPAVGAVHEKVAISGAAAGVTADVIVPLGDGPWPVLVYLHGGGWICGSPTTHAKLARRFAEAGLLVFNVDYRLAPEHPFPAPFEDCVAATRWAAEVAEQYGGDASRLAIGGDSAGGNLSAATAIALADDASIDVRAALLIYGVFDFMKLSNPMTPPGAEVPAALIATGEQFVELMVGSYLGSERPASLLGDPRVSPINEAAKLPPCHVMCGTADPLLVQAQDLAKVLAEGGVEHEYVEVPDMPHGFAQMEFLPPTRPVIEGMVAFLRKHLA